MKIIILGAGQVGATLAENLVSEDNDITVIDQDGAALATLQDKFDLRVIQGNGAHPSVLREAGAEDADMLVAVSSHDEINMIACQVAHSLFNTPTKIARIRSQAFLAEQDNLFKPEVIPVDHLIAPEQLVVDYIRRLVEFPGVLHVVDFAQGKVSLVAIKAYYGGPLVGNALHTFKTRLPNIGMRVVAIFRRGRFIRPQGSTIVEADDEVYFISAASHVRAVMSELQRLESPYRRIMIVGGGNVGAGLAKQLEKRYSVKLIEQNPARAEQLSELLENTLIFCGDASNQELLIQEHIEQVDAFIALTNEDESNIMSALLAKKLGAKKAMVLIQRGAYIDLIEGSDLDLAISPQQATMSALLTHVRQADIVNVFSLRRGQSEAMEMIVHGDPESSKVIGRKIGELRLPAMAMIGAIFRKDEVLIADPELVIESLDHLIVFLMDKRHVGDIERLFQSTAEHPSS